MMMPVHTTLDDWCSSLVVDFPDDDVPTLFQDEWKDFGNALVQIGTFSNNSCPSPDDYEDWQAWAYAVYYLMQNNSN